MSVVAALVACAMAGATVYSQNPEVPRKRLVLIADDATGAHTTAVKSHCEGLGMSVTVAAPSGLSLRKFGEWLFDHIVVLAADVGATVAPQLIEALDAGLSLTMATPEGPIPKHLAALYVDLGALYFPPPMVDLTTGKAPNVGAPATPVPFPVIPASALPQGGLPHAGGGFLLESDNPLHVPVLAAPAAAALTAAPISATDTPYGAAISVAVGVQTRRGSRALLVASPALLAGAAGQPMLEWALLLRGALRIRDIRHYAVGQPPASERTYRVNDRLGYSCVVETWCRTAGKWIPFVLPPGDSLQLEFVMLDPYVRLALEARGGGEYAAEFTAPDVYGVFKLLVDYRRAGLTPLLVANETTVRPPMMHEYERFIPAAYPYYAAVFSGGVAAFVFGFFALYGAAAASAPRRQ